MDDVYVLILNYQKCINEMSLEILSVSKLLIHKTYLPVNRKFFQNRPFEGLYFVFFFKQIDDIVCQTEEET